jgi:hypothetical protein
MRKRRKKATSKNTFVKSDSGTAGSSLIRHLLPSIGVRQKKGPVSLSQIPSPVDFVRITKDGKRERLTLCDLSHLLACRSG